MKHVKKCALSSARWLGSVRRLPVLTAAATVMTALCLSGCVTRRKAELSQLSLDSVRTYQGELKADSVSRLSVDSMMEELKIRTEAVKVAQSDVSLTLRTDSLRSLPPGASYSGRSGQASVKVSRKAATSTTPEYIYVEASCDSLELQCERYERTVRTLRSELEDRRAVMSSQHTEQEHATEQRHTEQLEKPPNGIGTALKWFFFGLLSGIAATIITLIKLKK